jgi:hypothetical protein
MGIKMSDLQKCLEKAAQCEDDHEEMEQGLADEHRNMQKSSSAGDAHHGRMADLHQHKAHTHGENAVNFRAAAEKCTKTSDDELGKSSIAVIRRLDALENAVVPTRISAVVPDAPGVRAVPRAGQRPFTDNAVVPVQFAKLVEIEE